MAINLEVQVTEKRGEMRELFLSFLMTLNFGSVDKEESALETQTAGREPAQKDTQDDTKLVALPENPVRVRLARGTLAVLLEKRKYPSGNYAYRVFTINTYPQAQVWVYFSNSDPHLKNSLRSILSAEELSSPYLRQTLRDFEAGKEVLKVPIGRGGGAIKEIAKNHPDESLLEIKPEKITVSKTDIMAPKKFSRTYVALFQDQPAQLIPSETDLFYRFQKEERPEMFWRPIEIVEDEASREMQSDQEKPGGQSKTWGLEKTWGWIPDEDSQNFTFPLFKTELLTEAKMEDCERDHQFKEKELQTPEEFMEIPKSGNKTDTGRRIAHRGDFASLCVRHNREICESYKKVAKQAIDLATFYLIKAIAYEESGIDSNLVTYQGSETRHNGNLFDPDLWTEFLAKMEIKPPLANDHIAAKKYESSYGPMQIFYPEALTQLKTLKVRGVLSEEFELLPDDLVGDRNLELQYLISLSKLQSSLQAVRKYRNHYPYNQVDIRRLIATHFNTGRINISRTRHTRVEKGERSVELFSSLNFENTEDYDLRVLDTVNRFQETCAANGIIRVKHACRSF